MPASANDPVRRVSVLSTGVASLRPQVATPTWQPPPLWLLTSRRWAPPVPINVFVIEHERGLVLFDTGQDRASVTDPDYYPGGLAGALYRRLAKATIGPADTLTAGLARLGYDSSDIRVAVISHLHQDHIGGVRELPNAEIIVSREEWDSLRGPAPELRGLLRRHIEVPTVRWRVITPHTPLDPRLRPFTTGHDVFDDGSLILLPTPGHTAGSLSMMVSGPAAAPMLLVGDLVFNADQLVRGEVPGVSGKRLTLSTLDRVRALGRNVGGLTILAAHDPAAAHVLTVAYAG